MIEVFIGILLMTLAMNLSLYLQTKIIAFEMEQVELRLASKQYRSAIWLEERIQKKRIYLDLLEEKVKDTNKNSFNFMEYIESLLSLSNEQVAIQTLRINAENSTIEMEGTTLGQQVFFDYFKRLQKSYSLYETYFYLEAIKENEPITFYISIYPREEETLVDEEDGL